jgi:hypothetical protein
VSFAQDRRDQLDIDLAELRAQLDTERRQLSPDARVTALAAVVQSEALLLMTDQLRSSVSTLVHDGLRPLMSRLPGL